MPGPYDLTPDKNLGFAANIMQGLQQGFGAYRQQAQANAQMDIHRQQMQAQSDLNRLKMQKLQQEISPMKNTWDKLQALDSLEKNTGYQFSTKTKTGLEQELVQSVRTPLQIQTAKRMADSFSTPAMAEYGMGGMDSPQAPSAKMMQMSPNLGLMVGEQPPQAQGYEQGNSFVPQGPGMDPDSARKALEGISPKEFTALTNYQRAKNSAGIGMAGVQQRGQAADMQFQQAMTGHQLDYQRAQDETSRKAAADAMKDELARFLGEQRSGTAITVANIGANSRVAAAKSHGAGKGAAADPQEKALLNIIAQKEKTLSDATAKPPSGFNMETAPEKAARIQAALSARDQAVADHQAYVAKKSGGRAQAPVKAGAPAASAGPKVLSGDVATIKAQARSMPEGVPYSTPSGTWVNRGGAPQQYVPQGRAPQSIDDSQGQ